MTSPEGSLPPPSSGNDLFGGSMMSPTAALNNTSGSSPGRPSLEERIRALDAKFSALEQNMQAAKDKPSQNSRAVDISKYVVKRRPSIGQNTAPGVSSSDSGPENSTKSLFKSSIFDQDTERLNKLDEKYAPSTAALLFRSSDVKSEPLEDILESLEAKDAITKFGSVKVKPEKPGKKHSEHKQGRDTKNPLSIHIPHPPFSQPSPVALPPAPVAPQPTGLSPSMLISPPPQRGILKRTKTPNTPSGTSLNMPQNSGPVFPPNLSVPPPPFPGPFGCPPGSTNGPVTPTDPRMAAKKDPMLRIPSAETPPPSAPSRPNSLFQSE